MRWSDRPLSRAGWQVQPATHSTLALPMCCGEGAARRVVRSAAQALALVGAVLRRQHSTVRQCMARQSTRGMAPGHGPLGVPGHLI